MNNPEKKRIMLVIASLRCGGAERVMSRMANYWGKKPDMDVTLATFAGQETDFYDLDKSVNRIVLGLAGKARGNRVLTWNVARYLKLRKAIVDCQPHTIISFTTTLNMLVILAAAGRTLRLLVSERTDPRMRKFPAVIVAARKRLYRRADAVVVQTESVRNGWANPLFNHRCVHVIPNPAVPDDTPPGQGMDMPSPCIAAVGRLVPEKGFDLLIEAFARSGLAECGWTLALAGDGPQKEALQRLAAAKGIVKRVMFCGQLPHPNALINQADMFVLSSRFEGFPNALVEAMMLGKPVVSTDCPSGPSEIITHGKDGLLAACGSSEELATLIRELADDPDRRRRLGDQARKSVSRYRLETVMALWENVMFS